MIESYTIDSMDRSEVLRYLGYHGQTITPELDSRIDQAIESCIALAKPRASILYFDIAGRVPHEDGTPAIQLKGTTLELVGSSIDEHMKEAITVGVFATTLGMGIERELKRLSLTDQMAHVLFDSAATTLVERAADAAEATIVAEAQKRGLFTNFRFSPGYGDMPMQTQTPLLAALDAQRRLGITLTSTLLMTPTKSVTAVVGMCPTRQESTHSSCADCFCREFCTLVATTGRTCRG